ncbi:hypothetical protein J6590_060500 [Homalodisca vitripennis]|nr:hypothetical protein J6590_060500 [Homalodisca vitripennis]
MLVVSTAAQYKVVPLRVAAAIWSQLRGKAGGLHAGEIPLHRPSVLWVHLSGAGLTHHLQPHLQFYTPSTISSIPERHGVKESLCKDGNNVKA